MKTVYFVLGMHRSGTSALGGVLNTMGLEFGTDLMRADANNPKGYFENNLVYSLNEKLLRNHSGSWDDVQFVFHDSMLKRKYINEARDIILNEFKFTENFAIKDPRICLLFPFWLQVCKELNLEVRPLILYRNPLDVFSSLKKRDDFTFEKSLMLWAHHFLSAEYYSREFPRIFLYFDDLVNKTDTILDKLEKFINLPVSKKQKDAAKQFIDKGIIHLNTSLKNFPEETPLFFQDLITLLKENDLNNTEKLNEIRQEFYHCFNFFYNNEIKKIIKSFQPLKEVKEELLKENKRLEKTKLSLERLLEKAQQKSLVQDKTIVHLNEKLNEVLIDFVKIKESNSWRYSKPLRMLRRILKG